MRRRPRRQARLPPMPRPHPPPSRAPHRRRHASRVHRPTRTSRAKVRVQEAAPVGRVASAVARTRHDHAARAPPPPAPPRPRPHRRRRRMRWSRCRRSPGRPHRPAAAPAALRLHSAATASQVQDGQITTMTVDLAQAAADEDARLPRRQQWLERIRARRATMAISMRRAPACGVSCRPIRKPAFRATCARCSPTERRARTDRRAHRPGKPRPRP